MIIDMHVKVGPSFNDTGVPVADYITEMEKNGIGKAVICPNRPKSYSFEDANNYLFETLNKYPDKFFGALRVDPWNWDKDQVDRDFSGNNLKFIYLNPWEDNFRVNEAAVFPVYEYAADNMLPVLIETGYPYVSHITQIGAIAEKFPNVAFITTNAGQIDLSGYSKSEVGYFLSMYKNIYMGTAAAVSVEWLSDLITTSAKGRVLFETGYPSFEPYTEKFRINNAFTYALTTITEDEKEEVFSKNILKLIR